MTGAAFRKLALSFADTEARPHFDRTAFRTTRRTFATLGKDGTDANVQLELDLQAELVESNPSIFAPCVGGWGRMGWTSIALPEISAPETKKILADAYALALPKPKLAKPTKRKPAKRA
ncbi:hypothetical protein BH09MYX1_BH09MYX1_50090 [soil metagenome]